MIPLSTEEIAVVDGFVCGSLAMLSSIHVGQSGRGCTFPVVPC